MSTSRTSTGTRKLSDVTKRLTVPSGIVSTGWPQVANTCRAKLGITYDDWQHGLGRVILAKRADGKLASTIDGIGLSAPRQVGKTYLFSGLLFALCIDMPGLLVIWSAQHSRTHEETFRDMQGFAGRSRVAPYIKHVHTGSGIEEIAFHNGSRILFGAREHGFGRGIPGVDVLVFDEAQILSEKAMSNMLATMNTSKFGLHVYIGTPPKPEDAGKSEVFTRMRSQAAAGELTDGAWIEIGAESDDKPDDRKVWLRMNPSHPRRTPAESILRLRRKLSEGDFRREGMGIWDEEVSASSRLIPAFDWEAVQVDQAPPDGVRSFAVAFSFDGDRAALAGAVKHADGVHLELIGTASATGLDSMATWLVERKADAAQFTISGGAMGKVLHQLLRDRGVPERQIKILSTQEYFAACGMLVDSVRDRTITVPKGDSETDPLEQSVAVSDKKQRGSGWGWQATTPDGDETPMEAVSVALYGARTTKRRPGRKQVMW